MKKISKSKWEKSILKSNNTCIFHSPIWAKALEKTYNYRNATALYEVNGKEILIPMMEIKKYGFKIFDSMPHGYGGIFSESELSQDNIKELLMNIMEDKPLFLHLTMSPLSELSVPNNKLIKEINDMWNYTHILKLNKNFEHVWKNNFKKKNRNAIRKARKSGIEIKKGDSLDDFKEYYKLYNEASQRWGYKNPPYPFKLYKYLYKYGSSHININFAMKDNKIIGGLITLSYAKTVFYWGSAYSANYGAHNSTNLLLSESIKLACQEEYKYYDFGASGNLNGVRKFKEGFGAQKVGIKRFRIPSNLGRLALFFDRGFL